MGGISRNSPCECGSGKKYKHCCLGKAESRKPSKKVMAALAATIPLGVICGYLFGWEVGGRVGVLTFIAVGIAAILMKPPEKNRDRGSGSNIDFGN